MANKFLRLDGIEGESVDDALVQKPSLRHPREIEVHNWTWDIEFPAGAPETSKVNVHNIIVHKLFDAASPALIKFCYNNQKIPSGELTCRKNDGEWKLDYLVIELKDIKIRSVKWAGHSDPSEPIPETVELSFARFDVLYLPQMNEGAGVATGRRECGWLVNEAEESKGSKK